jgi:UrcA family protein
MNTTKSCLIRALGLSTAIVFGAGAAGVSAGAADSQFVSDGMNRYVVRFPDLDLTKVDGAAVLYSRLSHAAGIVCSSLQSRDLTINAMYRSCVSHAIAAAVTRVDRPMLSQYHESHTQREKTAVVQLARAN